MTKTTTQPEAAREMVFILLKSQLEEDAKSHQKLNLHPTFSIDEVFVVWFNYTLGNWKALVSTTLPYGMYYEVTHNASSGETYIDVYKKVHQYVV